jgi:DNA-binding transcriptional LysR family regulator
MDRQLKLKRLWDRLPAFRAVAETEHLHRAAARLGSSTSALSRSLHLLEEDLGVPLFQRRGRSLKLTELGRELLQATRSAMDGIDETIGDLNASFAGGALRISSGGRLMMAYILPALQRLRRRHSPLVPHVVGLPSTEVPTRLARSEIDVALVFEAQAQQDIAVELLGHATNGVYCGRGHPLHGRAAITLDEVLRHPFAAPEPQPGMPALDRWPSHLGRRIALYATLLDPAIVACEDGELLAVLPDDMVLRVLRGNRLHRVPIDVVPPTPLYAMSRARCNERRSRVATFVDEVKREVRGSAR